MKKEANKKSKKWLWLVAGIVALLAVAGIVLAMVLPGQTDSGAQTVESKLYWNIDRLSWIEADTGMSARTAGEDGLFHIRFAVGGQQVELPVINDKQLVNYIDSMDVMGLVMDADGMVINALDPKEVATEVAKEMFVREVSPGNIVVNSSMAMNGMDIDIAISNVTGIYDVDPDAEVIGAIAEVEIMDKVIAYANEAGEVTDVFIAERAVEAGVYWRVEKMYDSAKVCTTREPDENGAYTILFAHNGEQVELKCKDRDLVNTIDAANNIYAEFALVLDDEGYIVDDVDVGLALKGLKACNNYDVTAVEGNSFSALRNLSGSNKGDVYENAWDENCDIFLVENGCDAEFVGQRVDSLKVGDRITVYTDLEGNPIVIFVINREVNSPMYYRLDQYSTKNSVTLRPKDANGYYVFEMACEGKTVKLRCKDDYVATRIEWRNPAMMGLKLEGDVIVGLHPASCVSGWGTAWNNYYVANISAPIVTLIDAATGKTYNRLLAEGAEIYDVTGNFGMEKGAVTTLQVGDKVVCGRNIADELTHVYVLQHYEKDAKLYYNMNRKYNSTTKETNRTPDENGYYVFEMLCEGKEYTLKTKNKKMADWIEAQSTSMVALTVSGSTIKNAFSHVTAFEYGYRPVNYNYVRTINKADNSFFTYYYDGDLVKEAKDANGEYKVWKMAKDCVVYNVSTGYLSYRGEKTTLKVDDQIQTFARQDTGEIVMILVINRKVDSPLYWPVSQKYSSTTKETTRAPDADGWYVFEMFENGQIKQFKTKDKEIASKVDSYSMGLALQIKGDVILNVYPANVAKNIKATAVSHYDITQIKGNELYLTRTRPLAGDYGKTAQFTMYKNTKIYDVSNYAENRGAKATLSVGDRVSVYTNMDGKAEYIFINYKNTHEKGHISYCEHCDKDVLWEPYSQTFYETDGHYYIPADMTSWAQKRVGHAELKEGQEQFEIVLDLNGKTVTAKSRLALVYSKLTILDTVGGGKVIGENAANGNGGVIMVTGGGQLDIRGGELTLAETAGCAKEGGVLYAGSKSAINMYGGTITGGKASLKEGATGTPVGGNVFVGTSTFNMYGGTITGGTAVGGIGGNLYLNNLATFNMEGGKIDGAFEFANGAKITLSGAPVIGGTGVSIDRGATIKLGELTKDASITVKAREQFTETTDKAETYVNYFKAAEAGASVEARDNALYYVAPPADYVSDLVFAEGTTRAECPQCGKVVTWTAIDQATYGETAIAKHANNVVSVHYYLAEDLTYTGKDTFFGGLDSYMQNGKRIQKIACFHLNGHNITATNAKVFQGNTGVMNIMGQGVVSGNYTGIPGEWSGNNSTTVGINTTIQEGTVNLFAGTYTKAATNSQPAVNVYTNGGTINLYKDATIDGTGTTGITVDLSNGMFVMYGGKIIGGDNHAVRVTNYSATAKGAFGMTGGTVIGSIEVQTGTTMALSGAPVIEGAGINMAADTLLALGELTQGASIKISAPGVFTEELADAESYRGYFLPAETGATIDIQGNALAYKAPVRLLNDDLVFDPGTQNAFCTVCQKKVTWKPIDQATYGEAAIPKHANNVTSVHYYLAEDLTYTGTDTFFTALDSYMQGDNRVQKKACFHLNSHNVTATAARVFQGNTGILNILGKGTVSGNYTGTPGQWSGNNSATVGINITLDVGEINLYGGTYTKAATNTQPTVNIYNNGGFINLYDEATIDGTGTSGITVDVCNGRFTMYGGKIIGGNGDAIRVANYSETAQGTAVILGGTVEGLVNVQNGTTLGLAGSPVITGSGINLPAGQLIQIDELTEDASVKIFANGVFAENVENAEAAAARFVPAGTGDTVKAEGTSLRYEMKQWTVTENLVFDEGTSNAFCAVCNKKVTWTELNQEKNGETAMPAPSVATSHYYLSEDVVYTGTATGFITAGGTYYNNGTTDQKTVCVHLNGNDLAATQTRVFFGSTGILNVLGEGTVSGNANSATTGSTVLINCQHGMGIINLYSGTYTKPETNDKAPIIYIANNGGNVNVYENAIIDGTGRTAGSNPVGAVVYGGTRAVNANQGPASLSVLGGKIIGGVSIKTQYASFSMNGGEIDGKLTVENGDALSLAGAAKIKELTVAAGKKLDVSGLTEGALIKVNATGIFTEDYDKIGDVATYIKPVDEHAKISVKGKALSCDKDYTGDLKFVEGTKKAFCVACNKEVTWTEVNQTTNGTTALAAPTVATSHYYLSEDITYTGTATFITAGGTYNNGGTTDQKTTCLHLNGNDLTATGARVIVGSTGIFNVLGSGTVTGGYVGTGDWAKSTAAAVHMNADSTNGAINLYGGTYTKTEGNPCATVVVHDNGGGINVYEGATVEGGAAAYHGRLNVYGAQISGGLKVLTRTSGKSPVVTVTDGTVDSVSVTAGSFTLAGASRLSLAVAEGKKITLGEMTEGAAITVTATGIFTETNGKAADYEQYFTAATEGDDVEAQNNALVYVKAN